MPADGLGLQTTISQSGAVAKTQARAQPAQQPTAPFSDKVDPGKDTHVERLKRGEPAERGRVEPDPEEERRRRRRGSGSGPDGGSDGRREETGGQAEGPGDGKRAAAPPDEGGGAAEPGAAEPAGAGEGIGRIVDCRA